MIKVHTIQECPDGFQGYLETEHFWIYYLLTEDSELFYDERYLKTKYKNFTAFKRIIKRVDEQAIWLKPPIELEEMHYTRIENFYYQRCF